jgi:predicted SAM-dependent methyltransferase
MIKKIIRRVISKIGFKKKIRPVHPTNKNDWIRLIKYAGEHDKIKLHFGCGPRILKGWVNFDIAFEPFEAYLQYYTDKYYPESLRGNRNDLYIVNILNDGLPLADESVDVIFHEDFFEHLTQKEQIVFLAETLRVMKKGAIHRINTPNLLASMRDNSIFSKGKQGVFVGEWDWWHHYSIMTPAILEEMAKIVGYSRVVFNSRDNSLAANDLPLEYRPNEKDRLALDSNVFADLIK